MWHVFLPTVPEVICQISRAPETLCPRTVGGCSPRFLTTPRASPSRVACNPSLAIGPKTIRASCPREDTNRPIRWRCSTGSSNRMPSVDDALSAELFMRRLVTASVQQVGRSAHRYAESAAEVLTRASRTPETEPRRFSRPLAETSRPPPGKDRAKTGETTAHDEQAGNTLRPLLLAKYSSQITACQAY